MAWQLLKICTLMLALIMVQAWHLSAALKKLHFIKYPKVPNIMFAYCQQSNSSAIKMDGETWAKQYKAESNSKSLLYYGATCLTHL